MSSGCPPACNQGCVSRSTRPYAQSSPSKQSLASGLCTSHVELWAPPKGGNAAPVDGGRDRSLGSAARRPRSIIIADERRNWILPVRVNVDVLAGLEMLEVSKEALAIVLCKSRLNSWHRQLSRTPLATKSSRTP